MSVLLLVLFLKGGLIGTLAIQAPTLADCEAAKPAIMESYKQVIVAGRRYDVVVVRGECEGPFHA